MTYTYFQTKTAYLQFWRKEYNDGKFIHLCLPDVKYLPIDVSALYYIL